MIAYLISLFPSLLGLPSWLTWWAIALPVILAVLAVLTICLWIGWVMLTTPSIPPLESPVESLQPKKEDEQGVDMEKKS
jgi:hypothetical protein